MNATATATTATATATATAKGVTFEAIKKALPEYFTKSPKALALALTDKAQKYAPLCEALTGTALERIYSGSSNNLADFEGFAKGVKGVNGAKFRAIVEKIQGFKPADFRKQGKALADYSDFAEALFVELLAVFAPTEKAKSDKPSALELAKARIAELETQLAESEALRVSMQRTIETLQKLTTTTATATAE